MRASEFLIERADPDKQLRDEIISLLQTEEDRDMLDKIYTTLKASTLNERLKKALSKDEDADKKLQLLSGYIMNTKGTYQDKEEFIKQFNKGFINTKVLLDKNSPKKFKDWFVGTPFAMRVFESLYRYVPQGVGAGEFALAVLSPDITFAGQSAGAGDLIINGQAIEVKAITASPGRFIDARKANMDQAAIKRAFEKQKIKVGRSVSAKDWVENIRPNLKPPQIKEICTAVVNGAFAHVNQASKSKLAKTLASGSGEQIKHDWALLSYANYKKMSKFKGILILNSPKAYSLYFENAAEVSAILHPQSPLLYGPEQEVHPKVGFKV